ncbi:MAG: 6-phosphogluconate dehydrogenase [Bacilli bacterium]|nr:6-phosphogluconate dehydrogenase [Bacilli bacterium]
MGFSLGQNLVDHRHEVFAFDISDNAREQFTSFLAEAGDLAAQSKVFAALPELVRQARGNGSEPSGGPVVLWMMIPAGDIVDRVLGELTPHLQAGDIVIDGGNSHYRDTLRRAETLAANQISYMDAGTSGGVSGARHGACFMVGGDQQSFALVEPIFRDISVENGYLYTGAVGSGHFLKMVHNGIEYGMMQSIGEGFELLERSPFDYNHAAVARVWNHGSVIRSWLMELMEAAFLDDPKLSGIRGVMHSSGEGKWTVDTALELGVPTPVIALSLMMRYRSEENDPFHGKVVAALRNQFGGHAVEKAD